MAAFRSTIIVKRLNTGTCWAFAFVSLQLVSCLALGAYPRKAVHYVPHHVVSRTTPQRRVPYKTYTKCKAVVPSKPTASYGNLGQNYGQAAPKFAGANTPASTGIPILTRMLHSDQFTKMYGTQTTVLLLRGRSVSSQQYVVRNGYHAISLMYQTPQSVAGEQIVDNGKILYHYLPFKNTLEVSPSRIGKLRGRIKQVLNAIRQGSLNVTVIGAGTIAGRSSTQIEVRPNMVSAGWRRFWVDDATGCQLGIDQFGRNGNLLSSSVFTTVNVGGELPKGSFRPPNTGPNVNVVSPNVGTSTTNLADVQAKVNFSIRQPTYLPPGFHFQSASTENVVQSKVAALRYTNGLNILSVYESSDKTNGERRQYRPRKGVVAGSTDGLRIIVVGNTDESELEKVFSSI